jgi:hypothetical protein
VRSSVEEAGEAPVWKRQAESSGWRGQRSGPNAGAGSRAGADHARIRATRVEQAHASRYVQPFGRPDTSLFVT